MVELERLSRDPVWLDKAIRIVDRLVREGYGKQEKQGFRRIPCRLTITASLTDLGQAQPGNQRHGP
jgi:hypothetical protein